MLNCPHFYCYTSITWLEKVAVLNEYRQGVGLDLTCSVWHACLKKGGYCKCLYRKTITPTLKAGIGTEAVRLEEKRMTPLQLLQGTEAQGQRTKCCVIYKCFDLCTCIKACSKLLSADSVRWHYSWFL